MAQGSSLSLRHLCFWSGLKNAFSVRRFSNVEHARSKIKQHIFKENQKCAAVLSTSQCIFENLALEDWLYENLTLEEDDHLLLLWRNHPAVVIGKFQNPWAECSVADANAKGVRVCRRKSGGGAVYHDLGNLNCSFFTHRSRYNRKANLAVIVDALRSRWNLNVALNKRDDILLNDEYKVSGTAAKLGRTVAYHHCTLLIEADCSSITKFLRPALPEATLDCSATRSTRAATINLKEACPAVTCEEVTRVIIEHHAHAFTPGYSKTTIPFETVVDPMDEVIFGGVHHHLSDFLSWQWTYGRTPPFSVKFHLDGDGELCLNIENGLVASASSLSVPPPVTRQLNDVLVGTPLCQVALDRCTHQWQEAWRDKLHSRHGIERHVHGAVQHLLEQVLRSFSSGSRRQ